MTGLAALQRALPGPRTLWALLTAFGAVKMGDGGAFSTGLVRLVNGWTFSSGAFHN